MKTRLTLRSGQNGTKKLLDKYGDRLLAVRYCYDDSRKRRFKTVELVEEELPWISKPARRQPATPVLVRLEYEEAGLRQQVKDAGGIWHKDRKLWTLDYATAQRLRLAGRIIE